MIHLNKEIVKYTKRVYNSVMNDLNFSGECFKITKFNYQKDYAGVISVRGVSRGRDCVSAHIVEMSFYIPHDIWDNFVSKLKVYEEVRVAGHFESWMNETASGNVKIKIAYVADDVTYLRKY